MEQGTKRKSIKSRASIVGGPNLTASEKRSIEGKERAKAEGRRGDSTRLFYLMPLGRALPIPPITLMRAEAFIRDVPEESLPPAKVNEEEEAATPAPRGRKVAKRATGVVRRGSLGQQATVGMTGKKV